MDKQKIKSAYVKKKISKTFLNSGMPLSLIGHMTKFYEVYVYSKRM